MIGWPTECAIVWWHTNSSIMSADFLILLCPDHRTVTSDFYYHHVTFFVLETGLWAAIIVRNPVNVYH